MVRIRPGNHPNFEKNALKVGRPRLNVPQKGVGHFFLFRSPFGNHFVTFLTFFGYVSLPIPFCLPPFAAR